MLSRSARRVLSFYFFLLLMNVILFFYEVVVVGMMPEQSFVFRSVTLVTDLLESLIFIKYMKDLPSYILKIFGVKIRQRWLLGGIKLSLIGPNVYLVKLFIVNYFLENIDFSVPPIAIGQLLTAYSLSLFSSFFWGVMWVEFIERLSNKFLNKWKICRPAA